MLWLEMPLLLTACALLSCVHAFNLDVEYPLVYKDPKEQTGSYFGYAVALLKETESKGGSWLIVGAPKSNSSFPKLISIKHPGVAYQCKVSEKVGPCDAIPINVEGEEKLPLIGSRFQEKLEDGMLGSTMDVQDDENRKLVVCAPGWKNQYFDASYHMNGACYAFTESNKFNTSNQLLPLIKESLRYYTTTSSNEDPFYYIYGEAGFSAHFVKNSKKLIIGAPGIHRWKGSAIKYDDTKPKSKPIVPNPSLNKNYGEDSYFGYSVSSGRFLRSNDSLYVSGAPRAGNLKGKVFIYDFPTTSEQGFIIRKEIIGEQMGEYFGSCLCVVDLNSDGLDDLVVGAPHHSLKTTNGDQGKIYIFINQDNYIFKNFEDDSKLTGSQAGGRFGFSVSHVGDLNNDGYSDIAVGAPYEDNGMGAVYIFHGGIKPKFVQRIPANKVDSSLLGFGFSISKGSDIDGNYYNDIAVGAYENGHAVIFRSHPVITFTSSLSANDSRLKFEAKGLMANACISYTGKHVPESLTAVINLEADPDYQRAQFVGGNTTIQYHKKLRKDSTVCEEYEIVITAEVNDYSKPLKLVMKYELLDEKGGSIRRAKRQTGGEFCKFCPVVNETSPSQIIFQVPYVSGCENDDMCRTDIITDIEIDVVEKPMVIGSKDRLKLTITVKNIGEPAFLSETNITFPIETPLINLPSNCKNMPSDNDEYNVLQCEMGNPLGYNETRMMRIEFDSSDIPTRSKNLYFKINSTSTGADENEGDNFKEENIPLISISDLSIVGKSSQDRFSLVKKNDIYLNEMVSVSHAYQIHNGGPTSIKTLKLTFGIPVRINDSSGFTLTVKVNEPKTDINSRPFECSSKGFGFDSNENVASLYSDDIKDGIENIHKRHEISISPQNDGSVFYMSCTIPEVKCMIVECTVGPLKRNDPGVFVDFPIQINTKDWKEILQNYDSISISSFGSVDILDTPQPNQPEISKPDFADVITHIGELRGPKVPAWVVVLAIIVGIILLITFTVLLKKMGFFKRPKKEELEHLKKSDPKTEEHTDEEEPL